MQNIEIKVQVPDLGAVRKHLGELNPVYQWITTQTDTYFHASKGRLKLREASDSSSATLISYERPDRGPSRISQYRLLPVSDPDDLKQMLTESLGVLVVVRKRRELHTYGSTRIHLDEVQGLGSFVELETVIAGQTQNEAWNEHRNVLKTLELDSFKAVPFSYSDLMLR